MPSIVLLPYLPCPPSSRQPSPGRRQAFVSSALLFWIIALYLYERLYYFPVLQLFSLFSQRTRWIGFPVESVLNGTLFHRFQEVKKWEKKFFPNQHLRAWKKNTPSGWRNTRRPSRKCRNGSADFPRFPTWK